MPLTTGFNFVAIAVACRTGSLLSFRSWSATSSHDETVRCS